MPFRAGFAQIDITPPVGTRKIGWLKEIVIDAIADPLFARGAVITSGAQGIGIVQLDTLCVRWTQTNEIRRRIEARYGFPGSHVMVCATHNHAGPAVASCGDVRRDDAYVETMIGKVVDMFGEALAGLAEAQIGAASVAEFGLSHNRRVVMRDGTARTHGSFRDPDALYVEGPIDPQVTVIAARGKGAKPRGLLVNFACHPTDHGGDTIASAGFPGVLAREMAARGWPVTLFLNGACGNICSGDPHRGIEKTKEDMGLALADDVATAVSGMSFGQEGAPAARSRTIHLPYRHYTEQEVRGALKGAQRFVDPQIYDRGMPALLRRIKERGTQPAQVQVLSLGEHALVGIPAEYFVELGLRIKQECHPHRALVVSCANGMVGYVPHQEAFRRGGYETTFGEGSALAPEAGDMLAEAAVSLVREGEPA